MIPNRILLFDSGIGGLSVLMQIQAQIPDSQVVYIADDTLFPYGDLDEKTLVARVVDIVARAVETLDPALVVIACNTASTVVMSPLRARFTCPFVGIVPAIKPAAKLSRSGVISVLATPATVKRPYLANLVEEFAADKTVNLIGAPHLAGLAETYLQGGVVDEGQVAADIAPCFYEHKGKRCDTIVLGCTHYPFLLRELVRQQKWPVTWLGPAHAVARRAASLLQHSPQGAEYNDPILTNHLHANTGTIHFTSDKSPSLSFAATLDHYWLRWAPLPFAL